MENTQILFSSYEVSEIEETAADFLYRAFGLLAECNVRYHVNTWSAHDGLVFKVEKCPLINYKPCFDPFMVNDPKRFTNGVHNQLLAFVERWDGKFTHFIKDDVDMFMLTFNNK